MRVTAVSIFASGGMPEACPDGHPWGPGKVLIGWEPCDCLLPARHGHHWVKCEAPGCRQLWRDPPCQRRASPPAAAADPQS